MTTEKRKLVQAETAMVNEEGEMLETQMELQRVNTKVIEVERKQEKNKKFELLFQSMIKKSKTKINTALTLKKEEKLGEESKVHLNSGY